MISVGALLFVGLTAAPSEAPSTPAGPTVVPVIQTQDDEAHQIGVLLRCPVCQGMPIAESPSQMAQDMMTRVRAMHDEGKSSQEILDYFVDKYGEWVLLKPKAQGMNLGLWILPIVALLFGGAMVVRYAKRPHGPVAAPTPETDGASIDDEYLRAIRDEVDQ